MKKRKGLAIAVVMFFAFAISIVMITMVRSNSSLTSQTKTAIYQMQASYLAHSGIQFAKLHIYLLPKEIYNFYQNKVNSTDNALDECTSFAMLPLDLAHNYKEDYDLFDPQKSPSDDFPYKGTFVVTNLKYLLSNDDLKMVQDNYHIEVEASIWHGSADNVNSVKGNRKFTTIEEEDFIVSRFAGR